MKRAVIAVLLVLALVTLPALAQETVPPVTPEVIDGSTPAPSVVVTVPDTRDDLYGLITLAVAILVPAVVAIREIAQTQNVTEGFIGFLHSVTENQDLTARLQREYLSADPKHKAIVELLLSLGDTIVELTPDERDDFVKHWTDYIRGVRIQRGAQAQKK